MLRTVAACRRSCRLLVASYTSLPVETSITGLPALDLLRCCGVPSKSLPSGQVNRLVNNMTATEVAPPPQAPASIGLGKQQRKIVFVLGGPGSGKGTQCARLVEEFGVVHLSAGDLLREHMKSGSEDGNMVAEMIKNGQIVPSYVTIELLEKAMAASGKDTFLIDGFPRNEENRAAFEKQTGSEPAFILFFDCPEDVMTQRLLGRNEGRTDDNIETIQKRFRVFRENSLPVVDFYDTKGKVYKISATRPVEDVYSDVRRLFLD